SFQHRNSYQEIAHAPLFSAVTKFSSPVYSTGELPRLLRHAWRAALSDTPRPTHLDFNGLQGDVIELGQTAEPPVIESEPRRIPVHRPVADERDIERAAALLTGARRVAIVAGDGAAASAAGPEALALAEALAAPVATTLGARGIIPTRHRPSARIVADWRASMTPLIEKSTAPISVERLCAEVTRALPADGILVADTGYSGIWTGTMIELNGAGQTYQRAAGSLGWAFPASLGATCAAGQRKVVCFTGDGGVYYHLAELA